jgi:hypothetical protein
LQRLFSQIRDHTWYSEIHTVAFRPPCYGPTTIGSKRLGRFYLYIINHSPAYCKDGNVQTYLNITFYNENFLRAYSGY